MKLDFRFFRGLIICAGMPGLFAALMLNGPADRAEAQARELRVASGPVAASGGGATNYLVSDGRFYEYGKPGYLPGNWDDLGSAFAFRLSGSGVELTPGLQTEARYILLVEGEPLLRFERRLADSPLGSPQRQAALQRQTAFLQDRQARVMDAIRSAGIPLRVLRTMTRAVNAIVVQIPAADRSRLQRLAGVRGVYPDSRVRALADAESAGLPGVRSPEAVRPGPGATGAGMLVAVIDTGIDYTHPDLGGCLGTGCKVTGGYDFVNGDADPFDDNGHGTHVAGIIAGLGVGTPEGQPGVRGVAPEAALLALKALDAYGFGTASDLIAAIELAADPDGNPATNDRADVINLSVGGPGDADDPLCQAADNASAAGIVVAVAAGNDYSYNAIGSPGSARAAITVGAIDSENRIADFSSRGPAARSDAVKPDLMAQGVDIRSAVPLAGELGSLDRYRPLSGTSMATPQVAGAAALLRQLHPDWTAGEIKARLMNTAVPLEENVFAQGAGAMNLTAALNNAHLLTPGSLSLGMVDSLVADWSASETVLVVNRTHSRSSFVLSFEGVFPAGLTAVVDPASFALEPGQSQAVIVTVQADNGTLPFPEAQPFSYQRFLRADVTGEVKGGEETLYLPLAVRKAAQLTIHTDTDEPVLDATAFVWNADGVRENPVSCRGECAVLLAPGAYSVLVQYDVRILLQGHEDFDPNYFAFRENVSLETVSDISVPFSSITHTIQPAYRDRLGNSLSTVSGLDGSYQATLYVSRGGNRDAAFGFGVILTGYEFPMWDTYHLSDVSGEFQLEFVVNVTSAYSGMEPYEFFFEYEDGIATDLLLQNDPAEMRRLRFDYAPLPGVAALRVVDMDCMELGEGVAFCMGAPIGAPRPLPASRPVNFMPRAENAVGRFYSQMAEGFSAGGESLGPVRQMPNVWPIDSGTVALDADRRPLVRYASDNLMVGGQACYWSGWMEQVPAAPDAFLVSVAPRCRDQGLTADLLIPASYAYDLYRNDGLVDSGTMGAWGAVWSFPDVPSDGYRMVISPPDHFLAGQRGSSQVTLQFSRAGADVAPPGLHGVHILENGFLKELLLGGGAEIRFTATDDTGAATVTLEYDSGAGWQALALSRAGDEYRASLPDTPPMRPVHLRFRVADAAGNSLEVIVQAAFLRDGLKSFLPFVGR